jgi:tripartite ATP-independent transporter DctP family solute receptor
MTRTIGRRAVNAGLLAGAGLAMPFLANPAHAETTLILSHHLPTTHIGHLASLAFAEAVKQRTGGALVIDIKPNSVMFNLRTAAEAIRLGTLDLCWTDLGTLGNWRPEFGITSLPFIFNGYDHVHKVLYGPVGDGIRADVLRLLNIEILGFGASGFRVFLGTKTIRTADDCKGIKLRVPEIPIWVEMARSLNANPTPLPAGEMYTALQTGVIDEVELPPDFIAAIKLWEVGTHSTRTFHIFTEASVMGSTKRLKLLPLEQQAILREEAHKAIEVDMWAKNLAEQQDAWNQIAAHTQAIPDPDLPSFRAKTAVVIENFVKKNGETAQKYVEAIRAAA